MLDRTSEQAPQHTEIPATEATAPVQQTEVVQIQDSEEDEEASSEEGSSEEGSSEEGSSEEGSSEEGTHDNTNTASHPEGATSTPTFLPKMTLPNLPKLPPPDRWYEPKIFPTFLFHEPPTPKFPLPESLKPFSDFLLSQEMSPILHVYLYHQFKILQENFKSMCTIFQENQYEMEMAVRCKMNNIDRTVDQKLLELQVLQTISERKYHTLFDNLKKFIGQAAQHIGNMKTNLEQHNSHLQKASEYFKDSRQYHSRIGQYYKQIIPSLDKLEADVAYMVKTMKAQYTQAVPEEGEDAWIPPIDREASSSVRPPLPSQQDAQLTHVQELLQKQTMIMLYKMDTLQDTVVSYQQSTDHKLQQLTEQVQNLSEKFHDHLTQCPSTSHLPSPPPPPPPS